MRYFTIPETETIIRGPGQKPEPMSFTTFMVEFVWNQPAWRDDVDSMQSWARLVEVFAKNEKPGMVVALTDKDHEKLLPMITMKGLQVASGLSTLLNRYSMAFLMAPEKEPKPKVAEKVLLTAKDDTSSKEGSGQSSES